MSHNTVTKAASIGDIEVLVQLINDKADVEERSGMAGNTPLHCAARADQFEAVKLLLENKSDVNAQRKLDLITPLHSASHAGNLKIVEYLVAAGAKYWLLDKKNNTSYDVARRMKNNNIAEFLAALPERKPEDSKTGKQRKTSKSKSPIKETQRSSVFSKIFGQRGRKPRHVLNGVIPKLKSIVEKVSASRARTSSAATESPDEKEIVSVAPVDDMRDSEPEKIDYPPVPPLDAQSIADTWLKLTGDVKCDDTRELYRQYKARDETEFDFQILKDLPRTVAARRSGDQVEQIRCKPQADRIAARLQDLTPAHATLFHVCRAVALHPLRKVDVWQGAPSCPSSTTIQSVLNTQGMNMIAAFLFFETDGDEFRTWQLMVRLLRHPRFALARVFQEGLPGLSLAEYQVKRCGDLRLVSLLQHLRALMLEPTAWLSQWLMTLFCKRYEELLSRGIRQMFHVIFEQGWPGVVRLVVAILQQSERHLLQCDFDDAMHFLHDGLWHTLDFNRVALAARHSDVSTEELTQYELVFATSQMRCRPVSVHQHAGKSIETAQSREAMDLADGVIATMGGGSESTVPVHADGSEISELRRQLKEVQQQRDMALQALDKSESHRRKLQEASREAEERTASVMDVFSAQQTARSKTTMQLQRQIIDLKRQVGTLAEAQSQRANAGDLLRTEASLLKRFDQLLLLHTQKDPASLAPKVGEFTSQQAILIATMPTSHRVEDRVRVALALKHAVSRDQLQRSSSLPKSSKPPDGWIPEDANVHTMEDLELTDYYQVIGKRIRLSAPTATHGAVSKPAVTSADGLWDMASVIEGRVCPLNVRGSDMSVATEGVNSIVFRALANTDAGDTQVKFCQVVIKGQLPIARVRSNSYEDWLMEFQGHEYDLQSRVPWSPFVVPLLHSFEGSSSLLWAWVPQVFKSCDTAHRRTTYAVMPYYPGTLKAWFDRFRLSARRLRVGSGVGLFGSGMFRSRSKKSIADGTDTSESSNPKLHASLASEIPASQRKQFVRVVAKVLLQLCNAISDIQKAHIVHRDLKSDNVFVDDQGFVKIGDFGCAKQFKRSTPADAAGESPGDPESAKDIPFVAIEQISKNIGAACAQAPEVMQALKKLSDPKSGMSTLGHVFGKADVFSAARIIWQICCGTAATCFPDTGAACPSVSCDLLKRKHRTACVSWPHWFDVRLRVVLTSLLQWDPQERMSADMAAFQLQLLLYGPPPIAQLRQEFVGGLGQQIGDRVLLRQWLCRERTAAILGTCGKNAAQHDNAVSGALDASSRYLRDAFLLDLTDQMLYSIIAEQKRLEKWYYTC